jgi:hypothetical protein
MVENTIIPLSVTTTSPLQIKNEISSLFANQKAHKEILMMKIRWTIANGTSRGMDTDGLYRLFSRVATNQLASQPMVDQFIKTYTVLMSINNMQFM